MATRFTHARIIDGKGGVIEDGWVQVEGGVITGVDRTGVSPPDGTAREVDLRGATLMPGLIDGHVHLAMDASADPAGRLAALSEAEAALHTARHAAQALYAGVTAVRDLGCIHHVGVRVRDAVHQGILPGPRMRCAGQMICMTGGHGWQIGLQADGPDAVRKAVRLQLRAGADVIKLMATGGICTEGVEPGNAQLTVEEMQAAVEEAHKAGVRTAAHAQGLQGVKNALRACIDSIEHGMHLDEEAIEIMLARNVFYVPTISAGSHMISRGVEAGIPAFMVEKSRTHRASRLESVVRAREAGVRIAMGTDAGTPFNFHGENAFELGELVRVGFSAHEALTTATSTAAELLGLENEIGTVAPGRRADLLVVEGDPLEDVSVLGRKDCIRAVYQGGLLVAERGRRAAETAGEAP